MSSTVKLEVAGEFYTFKEVSSFITIEDKNVDWEQFTLNNRGITILSGTMNYFRVPKEYWHDRLRKMRAAGLNTVETVVPWNLHEPEIGKYDFGRGGSEFEALLDIEAFLNATKEEDLFAVLKIGPIVDPDLDLGGIPSWLLMNPTSETTKRSILVHIPQFLTTLFLILTSLQFTNGGPIIGFYVGNEFMDYNLYTDDPLFSKDLMLYLRNYVRKNGLKEFIFTRDDSVIRAKAFIPGIINAFKFHTVIRDMPKSTDNREWLKWQNYWNRYNMQLNNTVIADLAVVLNYKLGYVNFYRFVAGTTFGFVTGSFTTPDDLFPVTNSYDFGSVITETGQYNPQYNVIRDTITLMGKNEHLQKVTAEQNVPIRFRKDSITISKQLSLKDALVNKTNFIGNQELMIMEELPIRGNSGQSYGYILYRKKGLRYSADSELRISGQVADNIMVMINGELKAHTSELSLPHEDVVISRKGNETPSQSQSVTLDILVENCGRSVCYNDYKGLFSSQNNVTLDSRALDGWNIYSLDFKSDWIKNLTGWYRPVFHVPSFYKATWKLEEPMDIYIDMRDWQRGVIILNGFVLARYLSWGPQQLAFAPASFQRKGDNEIIIFEHIKAAKEIRFTTKKYFHKQYTVISSIKYNSLSTKIKGTLLLSLLLWLPNMPRLLNPLLLF